MKHLLTLIRNLLIGGLLILLPMIVLVVLVEKAIGFIDKLLLPLTSKISAGFGGLIHILASIIVLLLLCLIAGLIAKTKLCKKFISYIEAQFLIMIPGYSFIKNMGENLAGVDNVDLQRVVLVNYDDSSQIGFLIEEIGDKAVVYLPDAPRPLSGSVIIFDRKRVVELPITPKEALRLFAQMGKGTSLYLNVKIEESSATAAQSPPA